MNLSDNEKDGNLSENERDGMNILIIGAKGFAGRNLAENLKAIRDGKNKKRPGIQISEIYEFDRKNKMKELNEWCEKADFVFHLAGVHRLQDPAGIYLGNIDPVNRLVKYLEKNGNNCPVMFASSIQASRTGRFSTSCYGRAKRECEEMIFAHGEKTGADVYVYRFPNIVGKWAKPDYNSAVATFCNDIANDWPFTVNDPETEMELLFIDDLMDEMLDLLEGHPKRADYPERMPADVFEKCWDALTEDTGEEKRRSGDAQDDKEDMEEYYRIRALYNGQTPWPSENGHYCYVPVTYKTTLGHIASLLCGFHDQERAHLIPEMPADSLEKKLYSVYMTYIPKRKFICNFQTFRDERGSLTELFKTDTHGQLSLNIIRPGAVKGQHWHNSKCELFIVVSGHGLVRERRIDTDQVSEFEVSGDIIQAVRIIPGYTHSIQNMSDTENLLVLMWANEPFEHESPDTFREEV